MEWERWRLGSIPQKQPGSVGWQSQRGATILGAVLGVCCHLPGVWGLVRTSDVGMLGPQ